LRGKALVARQLTDRERRVKPKGGERRVLLHRSWGKKKITFLDPARRKKDAPSEDGPNQTEKGRAALKKIEALRKKKSSAVLNMRSKKEESGFFSEGKVKGLCASKGEKIRDRPGGTQRKGKRDRAPQV